MWCFVCERLIESRKEERLREVEGRTSEWEGERERERERHKLIRLHCCRWTTSYYIVCKTPCSCIPVIVCVCLCVRERERHKLIRLGGLPLTTCTLYMYIVCKTSCTCSCIPVISQHHSMFIGFSLVLLWLFEPVVTIVHLGGTAATN